ncbi:MAG: hypothetical protein HETSPECPRED_007844 [Heterodermia speciosa]|uniref:Uncharacterized protein n=1 Tax=Heterodermia speciosa TaxID=116794 RepID=A0A8H3G153_9LECA|nr:MAG: hypothetical protein HETSPECPRED_007844 [Heterodermia speciosa]
MASALGFSEQQLHELKVIIEELIAKYCPLSTPPPPRAAPPIAVASATPPPPAPPAPPAAVKSSPPPRSPISIATANTKRRCMAKSPPAALAIATPPPAAWPLAFLLSAAWQLAFSSLLLAGVLARRPPPQGIG